MGTLIDEPNLKNIYKKNFISFKEKIDFNFLSCLLDRNHFSSNATNNFLPNFIFDCSFRITNVENDFFFKEIFNFLTDEYNKTNKKADFYIYFSLVSGATSITHRDEVDVIIISLYGTTVYKLEDNHFTLEPGDFLFIEKNKLHKAIGLTPRIILSYAMY